jgi:hypothetical protein
MPAGEWDKEAISRPSTSDFPSGSGDFAILYRRID